MVRTVELHVRFPALIHQLKKLRSGRPKPNVANSCVNLTRHSPRNMKHLWYSHCSSYVCYNHGQMSRLLSPLGVYATSNASNIKPGTFFSRLAQRFEAKIWWHSRLHRRVQRCRLLHMCINVSICKRCHFTISISYILNVFYVRVSTGKFLKVQFCTVTNVNPTQMWHAYTWPDNYNCEEKITG